MLPLLPRFLMLIILYEIFSILFICVFLILFALSYHLQISFCCLSNMRRWIMPKFSYNRHAFPIQGCISVKHIQNLKADLGRKKQFEWLKREGGCGLANNTRHCAASWTKVMRPAPVTIIEGKTWKGCHETRTISALKFCWLRKGVARD